MLRSTGHGNEVSVIALTTGEATTQAAIESLDRQTAAVADIIVVRDVAPFFKAFNTGAAQVKTRFFVQLDADMILDAHCIADLRKGMQRDVGIVVGHLRDPLIGRVVGIKLFRTECFEIRDVPDSISPDTDFVAEIARAGWKTIYIGRQSTSGPDQWATYGEHRPDYSLPYTYRKYLIEGCRYHYRQTPEENPWHFAQLEVSGHPSRVAAQVGLAKDSFSNRSRMCKEHRQSSTSSRKSPHSCSVGRQVKVNGTSLSGPRHVGAGMLSVVLPVGIRTASCWGLQGLKFVRSGGSKIPAMTRLPGFRSRSLQRFECATGE